MDVVLLKEVHRLGKEGQVVQVKPGYARNFLLPRRLAEPATDATIKAAQQRARRSAAKAEQRRQELEGLKQRLEKHSLTLKLTVGEQDTPFGSITANDIVEALQRDGFTVEKAMIQLDEPIKALGTFGVPVRLHADLHATLKLWVVKA